MPILINAVLQPLANKLLIAAWQMPDALEAALAQRRAERKSLFERYYELFTDPTFLIMIAIAAVIVYFAYRYYVKGAGRQGRSEQEANLALQLEKKGWQLIEAQPLSNSSGFANKLQQQTDDVFSKQQHTYYYYKVKARPLSHTKSEQLLQTEASIAYTDQNIEAIYWLQPIPQL